MNLLVKMITFKDSLGSQKDILEMLPVFQTRFIWVICLAFSLEEARGVFWFKCFRNIIR